MRNHLLTIFVLALTCSNAFSQKQLTLHPYLGLQTGFWYNKIKPEVVTTTRNFVDVELDAGVVVSYKTTQRFGYNLGVYMNVATNGYAFILNTGCPQNAFTKSWSGAGYTRFGLGVDYVLSKKVLRTDFSNKKSAVVIQISGGVGLNKRANEDLNCCTLVGWPSTDACGNYAGGVDELAYNIRNFTTSVWVRPWIILYTRGKERVSLSFIFNQGLMNAYDTDVTYHYNGTLYKFTNGTRGTTFGFNLSYPIVLKRWKQKP